MASSLYAAFDAGLYPDAFMDSVWNDADLPDLCYDTLGTPPSATSCALVPTPPADWMGVFSIETKGAKDRHYEHQPQHQEQLHGSFYQGMYPYPTASTLPPIDTAAACQPYTADTIHPSLLFSPYSHPEQSVQDHSYSGPVDAVTHPSSLPSPSSISPVQTSTPLELHQPKPFRRIPIVSLSSLASACDGFVVPPPKPARSIKPEPTTPQHHILPSAHSGPFYAPFASPQPLSDSANVIACNCGCRESYAFRY